MCPRFFMQKYAVYWPEGGAASQYSVFIGQNVIDWLGKWRPTCVMRHAQGHKLQSFRRKWPFYMDLYFMVGTFINEGGKEGVTNLGAGHKKGNLTSCPMLG